jgi:hypothetical protein
MDHDFILVICRVVFGDLTWRVSIVGGSLTGLSLNTKSRGRHFQVLLKAILTEQLNSEA